MLADTAAAHLTDKGYAHHYFEIYDLLLGRHRTTARRILEIGMFKGDSLDVWREAFPQAEIHGMDVRPIRTFATQHVGNAYSHSMLRDLPAPFDIIIDDGDHTLNSMLFVAEYYTRLLTPTGTLIIEDVPHTEWFAKLAARVPSELHRYMFGIDRTVMPGVPTDSRMFVVDKWN